MKKKYKNIYPAEAWAKKIQSFLVEIAKEHPYMYSKTQKRYENLATSLMESLSLISSIIDRDVGQIRPGKGNSEISEKKKFNSPKNLGSPGFNKVYDPTNNQDNCKSMYQETCEYYDMILEEASKYNFGFSEVNDCAKSLYKWFHVRFMPNPRDPNFVCQIRYLPTWMMDFILVYGRYFQQNKIHQFHKVLDQWCEKVESGDGGIYTIPYEVYRIENEYKRGICQPEDYTIEAVIINDILSSCCLYKLSEDEFRGDVKYNPGSLANIVKDRNPTLFAKIRTRIAKRNELVREIGLTPVGGLDCE